MSLHIGDPLLFLWKVFLQKSHAEPFVPLPLEKINVICVSHTAKRLEKPSIMENASEASQNKERCTLRRIMNFLFAKTEKNSPITFVTRC